tara:strand:- start:61 stop:1374 length:1314 start_codon:yes stop_codon:yes gene_type:complete
MAYVDIIGSKNVYLHSEDHSNAAYTKNHISVGTTTEAPGGLGNKIIPSTTNITHFMYQNGLALTGPQTFSVFAKSGGYNFIKMYMSGSTVCSANFNLSTGVVGTTGGSGFGSARIQNVGDGWYRCEVTITANIASAQTSGGIYVTSVDGGVSPYSEAGDGTSGVFLFGNQLESGTGSSTYIKTEGSARSFAGSNGLWQYENTATVSNTYPDSADGANTTVVAGVRSYNKPDGGTVKTYLRVRKKGQINLFHYSEQFDNSYWTKYQASITANAGVAPDGTTTADKFIPDTTASSVHAIDTIGFGAVPAGTYVLSVYVKADGYNFFHLRVDGVNSFFNLTTGVVVSTGTGVTTTIEDSGNGWYRCSATRTFGGAARASFGITETGTSRNFTGDGTKGGLLWGTQINEGTVLTPYIKTGASASTTIERGEVSKSYFDLQG